MKTIALLIALSLTACFDGGKKDDAGAPSKFKGVWYNEMSINESYLLDNALDESSVNLNSVIDAHQFYEIYEVKENGDWYAYSFESDKLDKIGKVNSDGTFIGTFRDVTAEETGVRASMIGSELELELSSFDSVSKEYVVTRATFKKASDAYIPSIRSELSRIQTLVNQRRDFFYNSEFALVSRKTIEFDASTGEPDEMSEFAFEMAPDEIVYEGLRPVIRANPKRLKFYQDGTVIVNDTVQTKFSVDGDSLQIDLGSGGTPQFVNLGRYIISENANQSSNYDLVFSNVSYEDISGLGHQETETEWSYYRIY